MDDAVARSLAKWPNVPAVFGWLRANSTGLWMPNSIPNSSPLRNCTSAISTCTKTCGEGVSSGGDQGGSAARQTDQAEGGFWMR